MDDDALQAREFEINDDHDSYSVKTLFFEGPFWMLRKIPFLKVNFLLTEKFFLLQSQNFEVGILPGKLPALFSSRFDFFVWFFFNGGNVWFKQNFFQLESSPVYCETDWKTRLRQVLKVNKPVAVNKIIKQFEYNYYDAIEAWPELTDTELNEYGIHGRMLKYWRAVYPHPENSMNAVNYTSSVLMLTLRGERFKKCKTVFCSSTDTDLNEYGIRGCMLKYLRAVYPHLENSMNAVNHTSGVLMLTLRGGGLKNTKQCSTRDPSWRIPNGVRGMLKYWRELCTLIRELRWSQ